MLQFPEKKIEIVGKKVILTFDDFREWYWEASHQRTLAWWKIDGLRERLEASWEKIKDPIEFLHHLYYDKKMSFRVILEQPLVTKFYSVKWLRNLLVESFWWIPRPNTERTPAYDNVEENRIKTILSEVWSKVWATLDISDSYPSFSIRKLKSLDSRIEKVLYIFLNLLWISEEKLLETFQILEYWKKRVTTYLNWTIKDVLNNSWKLWVQYNELELNHWLVERWLRINSQK